MRSPAAAILLLYVPFLAHAQERQALAVVEKGVQAHGGVAGIKRLRVAKVGYALKGQFSFPGFSGDANITVEETYQLPHQIKKVIKGSAGSWHGGLAWAIDGDTWWDQKILNGGSERRASVTIHEPKKMDVEGMYRPYLVIETLADYQKFQWSMAPGDGDRARQLAAVLAKSDLTGAEITFEFSKETGLLDGIATRRIVPPTNKEVLHEEKYNEYRDFDGVWLPTTQTIDHDGKRIAEIHVTDVRFFEKLDDAEFAPPSSGILQLVGASLLGLACCFLGGWSLGKLQARRGFPAIRLAISSALVWGIGGCPLGTLIVFGLQRLGYSAESPSPGAVGLWMAFGGACAGFAGGWMSGTSLPVLRTSEQNTMTAQQDLPRAHDA
jgi:hypothetical protein